MNTSTETVLRELRELLGGLAGQDLATADPSTSFFDLGFDSLFMTQASLALKQRFRVKVTFRQLLESLTTLGLLAEHIAAKMPAAAAPSTPPEPIVPRATPQVSTALPPSAEGSVGAADPPTGTVIERLIREQLRVMECQLALVRESTPPRLRGSLPGPAPVEVAATPSPEPRSAMTAAAGAQIPPPSPTGAGEAPVSQHGPFRQLDRGPKGGLTEQQRTHLDWFIPRYVARTSRSKAYTREHRTHLADPRAVAGFKLDWKEIVYPIVSVRSEGASLWDLDGNRWVDVTMGFGVGLLGHSPRFITEAVREQLERGVEIGPQSPLAGEVARLICELTGMERVTFCNTGSEAVMAALRVCRTVTGRTRVVLFAGAYHGTFDEVLVKGAWVAGQPRTLAIAPGVAPNLISEITVLEYGAPASLAWIREHVAELAAVLVEPVQSRHPDLQPGEFLKEIREITRASETPLIFDEVITGFRCHPGGAQAWFGIRADLCTYGKVIGGGMPLGFIAGRAELMDAFDGGHWQYGDDSFPPAGVTFFAGTFVRHPLAMAAAKAMLLHLRDQGPELQAGLARRTERLLGELNGYFDEHGVPLHLERFTSVWYPHFGPEVKYGSLLFYHLREKGLHIWEGRPCFLSTAHSAEDEEFITRAFKLSVAEMQSGGFLPGTSASEYQNAAATARRSGDLLPPPPVTESVARSHPACGQEVPAAGRTGPAEVDEALERCPMTDGQLEMWLAAQIDPGASAANNASLVVDLRGVLDLEALRRAVAAVVQRHDGLRATCDTEGTELRIPAKRDVELALHDLAELPPDRRQAERVRLLEEEGRRVFDLVSGPLCAFQVLRLGPEEHLLLFSAQMIVCDGWGCKVVLEDLAALYSADVEGRAAKLEPAVPLRHGAARLNDLRTSQEARDSESYWLSQYAATPPPLDLPGSQPRSATRSFIGDRVNLRLSAEFYQSVKAGAKKLGSTPFALLLAAYQVWLHRLSGARDIVIGVPFAGQGSLGLDRFVGQCVHTLPLRVRVDPAQPFASLLGETKSRLWDAQEHWCTSYGALVQKLDLPHTPSRPALVAVLFNFDLPFTNVQFARCTQRISSAPRAFFQYDLGFNLVDEDGTLLVECDFNRPLFERATLEHWVASYRTLIESVLADPQQPVALLSLLNETERRERMVVWNATHRDLPDTTVLALLARQASETPTRVAVEDLRSRLTYGELDRRTNQLARLLQSLGIGPDTLVGLCTERTVDMVMALVAVLKTGAAYLPIDPAAPPDRAALMLRDAGAALVLTHAALLPRFAQPAVRLVCLDEDAAVIAQESADPVALEPDPQSLAYGIYTSGSNGPPKCVEITHRSLLNLLLAMQREPGLGPQDVMLGLAPLSFDIATMEILLPLVVGARLVVVPRDVAVDPELLADTLDRRGVTVMQATPVTWRMLIAAGWRGRPQLKALCGGENLTPELAGELGHRCAELWNLYGPTEATIWSCVGRVQKGHGISIGRPIANTQVYLVDERLQLVPLGIPGELLIGGAGLARQYRGQPELTAQRFVANPWGAESGARLYRTGDLGRYRPDGQIEVTGRKDFQLKIRGYRIEPGEIEVLLLRHPEVREAVVVARTDNGGAPALVAYVAAALSPLADRRAVDQAQLVAELRQRVRENLPDYMMPASFVVLDRLPLNANRKVDRQRLPVPAPNVVEIAKEFLAPRTATQERLARVWAETLKLERVGIRDNFFDLGGQSLLAVTLFSRMTAEFKRKLPLATLFKAPTIEQLAQALDAVEADTTQWASLVPIQTAGSRRPLFLVHGAGGNVLLYRALGGHLAPDYPLYGLQSQGLDGHTAPLNTVEEMATRYLQELRAVQARGPYFLGGYCLGGTIAYEMAQRLAQEGEEVALIAMLDCYNYTRALTVSRMAHFLQKIRFHLGNLVRLRPAEVIQYVREKIRVARDGEFASLLSTRPGSPTASAGVARAVTGVEASVQAVNDRAADIYQPRPLAARLTLFKPQVNYKFYPDPKMGWGDLALGGLDVVELPVNPHAMLMEPFVLNLATQLKARIDACGGSPPATRPNGARPNGETLTASVAAA